MNFTDEELGLFPVNARPYEINNLLNLSFFNRTKSQPVLLLTGGIAPLHEGHIALLVAAERALGKRPGRMPIKCIIPGHDSYLRQKTPNQFVPIQHRIMMAEQLLKSSSLVVDKDNWYVGGESMFFSSEVNFTTIHRVYENLFGNNVWIVFGSDNARFASNYADKGKCIVVKRPGYELEWEKWRTDPRLQNPDILFVEDPSILDLSSTKIRSTKDYSPKELPRKVILRRSEDKRPSLLCDRLADILRDYFGEVMVIDAMKDALWLDVPRNSIVLDRCIAKQPILSFQTPFEETFEHSCISREERPYFRASRLFKPGGYAQRVVGHRITGHQLCSFLPQIRETFPQGIYLVDDDVATGGTMKFMQGLCESHGIKVLGQIIARDTRVKYPGWEILDSKDFDFTRSDGGLTVDQDLYYRPSSKLGERIDKAVRLPYCYPFVCPTARASIPPRYVMEFSKRIITMNCQENFLLRLLPEYLNFLGAPL